MKAYPSVSVVIVNMNGAQHLPACIRSLRRLDYPADKVEIVVVDNGSKDGSVELLEREYPDVRLLKNNANEGFAKPSNDGARAATGEYVAFLNNDMHVEKGWLSALVQSLTEGGADCAGSLILNWDGTAIDFMDGGIGFYGYGFQKHFGEPLHKVDRLLRQDRELLFACGGSMLLSRSLFLEAGGFDESYFAYYEDVDLGWRLHVMGRRVVLSVRSRVCHRHNGTSRTLPRPRVQYLFERNKLYSCFKNYGNERFYKVFLPALLLEIREIGLDSRLDKANYDIRNPAAFDAEPVRVGPMAAMKLHALGEFVERLPQLREARARVQQMRRVDDTALLPLFEDPFIVFPKDTPDFLDTRREVVKTFGIDALLAHPLQDRVTFLMSADAQEDAAYGAVAAVLARDKAYAVTLVGAAAPGENVAAVPYGGGEALDAAAQAHVLVACAVPAGWDDELAGRVCNKLLVVDAAVFEADETPFSHFAAQNGACFFCRDGQAAVAARAALRAAGRMGVDEDGDGFIRQVEGETPETALAEALRNYCAAPVRLPRRQDAFADKQALWNDGPAEDTVEARLCHLERLMQREYRALRGTQEAVGDIREQSELMDRRFRKLKQRLAHLPVLKRFVKD